MREIKFRAWDSIKNEYIQPEDLINLAGCTSEDLAKESEGLSLEQYTGIKDSNQSEWYLHDIGRFPNGDTFVIRQEEWVEFYVDWIGEPECEDQARDFYRISGAEVIGNIHENQEL